MTALAATLTALMAAILLVWTSRRVQVSRRLAGGFDLDGDFGHDAPTPPVSLLVAAKDEQDNIERCLRSVLAQDYPGLEVIVVDDRSTDGTGDIVRRIAAEDARVRPITIEHLPPGWFGKAHAMQTAAATAKGEWLCMIDADCQHTSPRTIAAAVAYAEETGADMLSVLPNMEMRGFWENAVQPVGSGIMMIWFHPDKVNDPRRPHAYANGAFMLIRRAAYDAIGTHAAIRGHLNEDMHLARAVKAAGLKLRVVTNDGLYRVRMYTTLGESLRGWARNFYGTFETFRRLAVSLAVLAVMSLLPYAAAAFAAIALAAGAAPAGWLAACGLLAAAVIAMQFSVIHGFLRLLAGRPALAWTYPLGCAVAMCALVMAIAKLRKGATLTWRATTYARS